MKTEAFSRFIAKCLGSHHNLVRLDLVLVSARGAVSTVESVDIKDPRDYGSDERREELVQSFAETAQRDANGFGTATKYCLRAKFDDADMQPRSTIVNVHPEEDEFSEGIDGGENGGTVVGHLQQAFRHNEALARQLVAITGSFSQFATESMARMGEAIARGERDKMASFELIEELHTRKHERELEMAREARRDKTAERVVNAVVPLLPIAGGKLLMGKKAPVQVRNSPEMTSLREFGKSLTADEIAKAQEVFGPEKVAALLEILTSVSEEEDEPKSEERSASGHSGSDKDKRSAETSAAGFY